MSDLAEKMRLPAHRKRLMPPDSNDGLKERLDLSVGSTAPVDWSGGWMTEHLDYLISQMLDRDTF